VSRVAAALRRAIHERAGGACEYCLIPEALAFAAHEVDHVVAQKHGGATEAENLALSCTLCNKHKGSDLASLDPETGALTPLYHPRRERWSEHFRIEEGKLPPADPDSTSYRAALAVEPPGPCRREGSADCGGLDPTPDLTSESLRAAHLPDRRFRP